MIDTMRRALLAAAFAVIALALAAPIASAQTNKKCIIVNGRKVYVFPSPVKIASGSTGSGTFKSITPIPSDPVVPLNESLAPVSINVSLAGPDGTITTTLDPNRTPSATTIVSNGPVRYPATVTLRFYGIARVSSRPCKTYRSLTELVFTNNNVNTILPFGNTQFTLANDVDFEDADAPGTYALTLKAGTTSVTLN